MAAHLQTNHARYRGPKKLERFIDDLIDHRFFKNHREIAREIGSTDASLSLALDETRRRLTVENCLRLARRINEHPATVLRIADRKEAAAVVDDLWPRERDYIAVTSNELELIELWRNITMTDRSHLIAIARVCAEVERARTAGASQTARPERNKA